MTILILTNDSGGLYSFRKEILHDLVKKNKVIVCCPPGEYVKKIEKIGCIYRRCDSLNRRTKNPIKDLTLLHFYIHLIRSIKPSVVLTYTIKPNVYGGLACQMTNTNYISNVTGLGTAIENGGILGCVSTNLYRLGLRKARCVFFQNKSNLSLFIDKRIAIGRTRLIPGSGVNLSEHAFEEYPDENTRINLLYVGRVMRDKGFEECVEAVRQIYNRNNKVHLDIIGMCEENYDELIHLAENEGAITYHGSQQDVHSYYKRCHCVVLPSYHEGMANVLLEASSTGRPVIASRIPGCKEAFDEGITGYGCEVKSADSLEAAITTFICLPHEKKIKMGIAARKKMEKEFDRNFVIEAYREEIASCINEYSK